jgi:DNA-binding transcriptional MerR regulator
MPVLESYRGRDIIGAEELASVATSLVEHYSRQPVRGQLRMAISPRTVRHYLAEQLLGDPTGQTGASTVFNYGNLLRLLAVKKLLADHWSVVKIKEFMRAMDITALEEMVNTALTAARPSHQESRADETESARSLRAAEPSLADGTQEMTQSKLFPASPNARRLERAITEWVEIAPGLEIKVRRSFRPPASEEDRARLAMRFWSVIMKDE